MDILRFINSKAIRKHLADIHYEFNSLETAWLIYQCLDATIEEKHKAWTELIQTMPDCSIPERMNTIPQDSLHGFLKKYMELEDRYVKEFCENHHGDTRSDPKPYVYKFQEFYKDGSSYDWDAVFSDFSSVDKTVLDVDDDAVEIRCTRMQIDRMIPTQTANLSPDFEFRGIRWAGNEDEEVEDIFYDVFEGLWFDIPTPFKKGDIVWDPYTAIGYRQGPFVTDGVCLDCISTERGKEHLRRNGDTTDMIASGYFMDEDVGIYHEVMNSYMDLEYYENELKESYRVFIPLSNYLKGEIDEGLYARAYHQILSENWANVCKPLDYTREGMILAGLERKEEKGGDHGK